MSKVRDLMAELEASLGIRPKGTYAPGDTYSYESVTQSHLVTWTRDANGVWTADDGRGVTATDEDVRRAEWGVAGEVKDNIG